MKKIGVLNQMGGVGKTTMDVNLAAELARRGAQVLLIDADPQGSSLTWSAARQEEGKFPVVGLPQATVHRDIGRLGQGYDYVIIDGAPRVTDLARSVVMASDTILIPVTPSPLDVWAAADIVNIYKEVSMMKDRLNAAFVINRKIVNTAIGESVAESIAAHELPVLGATIGQRVIFAESFIQGQAAYEADEKSAAAKEVTAMTAELMDLIK
jgi:chromosome partitioning protein